MSVYFPEAIEGPDRFGKIFTMNLKGHRQRRNNKRADSEPTGSALARRDVLITFVKYFEGNISQNMS